MTSGWRTGEARLLCRIWVTLLLALTTWAIPSAQAVARTVAGFEIVIHVGSESGYDELWAALPGRIRQIRQQLGQEVLQGGEIHVLADLNRYFRDRGEPEVAPRWAQALALPSRRVILLRTPDPQPVATLAHELSHLAVHEAAAGHHVPRWFLEGFAMVQSEEWTAGRYWTVAEAALFGNTIPFSRLDTRFPPHHLSADLAYAQSFHFVRHLLEDYGAERVRAWLSRVADGVPWQAAFSQVFGVEFSRATADWRHSVRVWYAWVPALVSLITSWTLLALLALWARRVVRRRRQARLDAMAAREAELYPPDPDDYLFD